MKGEKTTKNSNICSEENTVKNWLTTPGKKPETKIQ